jgi:hypothetical protein
VFAVGFWRQPRMKNADWPRLQLKNESSASEVAARTHSQYKKSDRSRVVRLSKIAHMLRIKVRCRDWTKPRGVSTYVMRVRLQGRAQRNGRPFWRIRIRQVEFPSTVETNLIRSVFDREHPAEVTVAAAEDKLKSHKKHFHKSCVRWRRSTLPFASSHSSRERTLARARAIAQSAAP